MVTIFMPLFFLGTLVALVVVLLALGNLIQVLKSKEEGEGNRVRASLMLLATTVLAIGFFTMVHAQGPGSRAGQPPPTTDASKASGK